MLTLCGACATAVPPSALSVRQVIAQKAELDGRIVQVRGVVTNCWRFSCVLKTPDNDDVWLSVGSSERFDEDVQSSLGKEIVVEAKFQNVCVSDIEADVIAVCADRADTLSNPKYLGRVSD